MGNSMHKRMERLLLPLLAALAINSQPVLTNEDRANFSEAEIIKVNNKNIEVIKFKVPDKKFPDRNDVLAQIHFPKYYKNKKLSLIIHQHGSNRDGLRFEKWGGRTDEWGRRLVEKALERGYAIALLDSFYKRKLKPSDKGKFPNGILISEKLNSILSKDERFDKSKIFYSGFSYGASQVLKLQDKRANSDLFKAAVAAEPGCNKVSFPFKSNIKTLIIKGEDSHYNPIACEYYYNLVKETGNQIEYVSIPKVNHFFSLNGSIGKGIAVNGCSENIVIQYPDRTFKLADGTSINKKEAQRRCLTKESGEGTTREKLDEAINISLNYFDKYK